MVLRCELLRMECLDGAELAETNGKTGASKSEGMGNGTGMDRGKGLGMNSGGHGAKESTRRRVKR